MGFLKTEHMDLTGIFRYILYILKHLVNPVRVFLKKLLSPAITHTKAVKEPD